MESGKVEGIKLIVTDLDGTLLRTDKTVSEYTASIFERCRDIGIKIAFATARPVRAVTEWLNLPVVFDAAIYHNGAIAYMGDSKILHYGISPKAASTIIFSALEADSSAKLCVEINDRLYGNYDPSDIWPGIEITLTDFMDLPNAYADKILLFHHLAVGATMTMASKIELEAVAKCLTDDIYIEMSENTVGMIMNKEARKINAVKEIAARFGVALGETAAFGDDYNDIEMLRECGVGVAVANAIDEVKSVATYLCGDCDKDGVAKWLEENVIPA